MLHKAPRAASANTTCDPACPNELPGYARPSVELCERNAAGCQGREVDAAFFREHRDRQNFVRLALADDKTEVVPSPDDVQIIASHFTGFEFDSVWSLQIRVPAEARDTFEGDPGEDFARAFYDLADSWFVHASTQGWDAMLTYAGCWPLECPRIVEHSRLWSPHAFAVRTTQAEQDAVRVARTRPADAVAAVTRAVAEHGPEWLKTSHAVHPLSASYPVDSPELGYDRDAMIAWFRAHPHCVFYRSRGLRPDWDHGDNISSQAGREIVLGRHTETKDEDVFKMIHIRSTARGWDPAVPTGTHEVRNGNVRSMLSETPMKTLDCSRYLKRWN